MKEIKSKYQKRKERREAAERDQIKGKFGHGKRGYELNDISQIIYDVKRLDKGYHFCYDKPDPAHEGYSSISIYRFADERNKRKMK